MPLVTMKEVLKGSVEGRYAVGAFDAMDHLFAESIIKGAEEKNVPVILMVGDFPAPIDYDVFYPYLVDRIQRAKVPICLHFDHGSSFEACARAIRRGCTSVMIDGSSLPFEENVALTKKVVEMAHALGVDVEGEIGSVGRDDNNIEVGGNVETAYTAVEDAAAFAQETGVDLMAVSIGTVHGVYMTKPNLDFKRLDAIRKRVDIPLVMHGGSGLAPEEFHEAVKFGINKVNVYTGLSIAVADRIAEFTKKMEPKSITLKIFEAAIDEGIQQVKKHIDYFETKPLGSC